MQQKTFYYGSVYASKFNRNYFEILIFVSEMDCHINDMS